jgi:2'-5' RNA ligase
MEEKETGYRPRLFTGLALTPQVRDFVAGIAERLSLEVPGVRWVPPPNLHVTLKFLGWCEPDRIPKLVDSMAEAAALLPVELAIGGIGGFPSHGSARVVWVGAEDPSGRLKKVYEILEKGAARCGIPREKRVYRPHITIGRAKKKPVSLPVETLEEQGVRPKLAVGDIVLFRSELKSTGAEYTVVQRIGTDGGRVS